LFAGVFAHGRVAAEVGDRAFLQAMLDTEAALARASATAGLVPVEAAEAIAAGDSPLTPREADVLELAASSAPIDEIADRAALSPGTVRNYLSSAMNKLSAANRHEAVAIARRMGWI
jgi:two-component system response regulator DesR